jgi:aminocarboxymuconate-semialdehyde decarboxylase
MVTDPKQRDLVWDVHGHYLPVAALEPLSSGRISVSLRAVDGISGSVTVNDMPVGATIEQLSSVEGILAAMDGAGLDRRVLSPPPFTYRYWDEPKAASRLCRLLNDATAEVVALNRDRLFGVCTVALQDPKAAVAEMNRAIDELGLVGIGLGTNVDGRLLSDPSLRPFFQAVADRGAPVLVHPEFVPNPRYSNYYLINLLGMPVETGTTLANMMLTGMLAELPGMRVCFVHGGGVAPYLMGRWTHGWNARSDTRVDSSAPPAAQLQSIYWDSLTHSPHGLSFLVELMGADHVVIGTDAPFDMEDDAPLNTLSAAPRLSEEDRRQMRSISPVRWLFGDSALEL